MFQCSSTPLMVNPVPDRFPAEKLISSKLVGRIKSAEKVSLFCGHQQIQHRNVLVLLITKKKPEINARRMQQQELSVKLQSPEQIISSYVKI